MKNYIFGIEATEYNGESSDFVANHGGNTTDGSNNPYHKGFLSDPKNQVANTEIGRITSIPSPYARMHLTDLAFEEANCGIGILNAQELVQQQQKLADDYLRAMSHCLDIFELLYHSDELNLLQKGITLHKLNLVSFRNETDLQEVAVLKGIDGKPTQLGKYIKTLDLYRKAYVDVIKARSADAQRPYNFDFSSLYIFKYKGRVFAGTSPFTGFFTTPNCDLSEANIQVGGRVLLSNDKQTWRSCKQRDREFISFMYLLLKDYGLDRIFVNLFTSIEDVINQDSNWKNQIKNERFLNHQQFRKFNMGTGGLQKIPNTNEVYIRPDGLDCSYLKFLLYLQNPVDLTIATEEYQLPIERRTFDGNYLQWLGVNDILSDALFVLPYEVNENYKVISYKDVTRGNVEYRRCLVPVKSEALKYFSLDNLVNNITIERTELDLFTVELKIQLDGVSLVLRREYHSNPDKAKFPNGKLIQGSSMKPFAFGVYPFVKYAFENSPNQLDTLNIYKVLFYNVFGDNYKLEFYHKDGNGVITKYLDADHLVNKTNDVNNESVPLNCEYHHLQHINGFEYAELTVDKNYSSLIIPYLRTIPLKPNKINVAIDLGTSNTYIAYSVDDPMADTEIDIREIKTSHVTPSNVQWNELTFMSKRCEPEDRPSGVNACNDDDLVVRVDDGNNSKATSEMLDHQLCEFIPSRIDSHDENNYKFPIPSVLNFLRVNMQRIDSDELPVSNPLINTAIPFAYYERGMRQRIGHPKDFYYDTIAKGNNFKWYMIRKANGNYDTKESGKAAFNAFIRELLFIVRCHILSEGYMLSKVNLYWSYPLSFDDNLLKSYIKAWDQAYKDIIYRDSTNRVHYTSESRSPIYECIESLSVRQTTILVDVGGGSTDVIAYKNFKPLFVSSTKFAGNALYLCGALNNPQIASSTGKLKTLMYKYVQKMSVLKQGSVNNGGFVTQTIGLNEDMATIMNYGFAKYPSEFNEIFCNLPAQFMLMLHNSLLIYHIAQLCHAKSPTEMPVDIYLTGNGSKQIQMNKDYSEMINKIFRSVYNADESRINITFPANPKAATAIGTLKGIKQGIALDSESVSDSYVAYGDGKNVLSNSMHGAMVTSECNIDNVIANAMNFVEMFYKEIYTTPVPSVTKDEMLDAVNSSKGSLEDIFNNQSLIDDSIFLCLMSEVMERISDQLAARQQ